MGTLRLVPPRNTAGPGAQPEGRDAVTGPGPGRPRRYAESEELRLLFEAAFKVVARQGGQDVTIADVLAEAGVARRAFYRHFDSKEQLLTAMVHREAQGFAAAVTRRVEAAPGPWPALVAWVDEILSLGRDRPRARRAEVLGSAAVVQALPPGELARANAPLVASLTATLTAGAADGSFTVGGPDADAHLIYAATWDTVTRMREAPDPADRNDLRTGLLSFLRRALGVPTD
jgi:AcrR family transcriptional regulator